MKLPLPLSLLVAVCCPALGVPSASVSCSVKLNWLALNAGALSPVITLFTVTVAAVGVTYVLVRVPISAVPAVTAESVVL